MIFGMDGFLVVLVGERFYWFCVYGFLNVFYLYLGNENRYNCF